MNLAVPISPGELIDKLTILEIKQARIDDPAKVKNIEHELGVLLDVWNSAGQGSSEIDQLKAELKKINESLWEIEDAIRILESKADFGDEFITLARSVYKTNDQRAKIKKDINQALGSALVEEKSYAPY